MDIHTCLRRALLRTYKHSFCIPCWRYTVLRSTVKTSTRHELGSKWIQEYWICLLNLINRLHQINKQPKCNLFLFTRQWNTWLQDKGLALNPRSVNILPALCPSSLLADLGILSVFDVLRSRVLELLLSTPFSSPSSLLLPSAPGVTALCLMGEVGNCPGEHGDWMRLLHDLDLRSSTAQKEEKGFHL